MPDSDVHFLSFLLLAGKTSVQYQLDTAMQEVGDMYVLLEETEKSAVRKALVEERGRFCCLVNLMRPALVSSSHWDAFTSAEKLDGPSENKTDCIIPYRRFHILTTV